jgi:hypothetical protein
VPVVRRVVSRVSSLDLVADRVRLVGRCAQSGDLAELRDALLELSTEARLAAQADDPRPPTRTQRRMMVAAERDGSRAHG